MVLSSTVTTEGASHFERTHFRTFSFDHRRAEKVLHLYILFWASNIGKIELSLWLITLPSHTRTPCVREKQSSTLDNVFYIEVNTQAFRSKSRDKVSLLWSQWWWWRWWWIDLLQAEIPPHFDPDAKVEIGRKHLCAGTAKEKDPRR